MYFRGYGSLKNPKKWGKKSSCFNGTSECLFTFLISCTIHALVLIPCIIVHNIHFGKHHFTRARSKAFKKLHLLIQFALFYLFSEVFIQHQGNWIIFFMDQKYYWENITIKNVCPVFPRTECPSRKCYFCHCPKLIQ